MTMTTEHPYYTTVESKLSDILTPERLSTYSEQEMEELIWFIGDENTSGTLLLEALAVIEGKKGSGKTQLSIALLSKLKKYFDVPVVTDQRLKPSFGDYMYLNEKDFVAEISKVSDIAKSTPQEDIDLAVEWSLKKAGIKLDGAVILLDESYKYFDCRKPTDRLVLIFGYFVAQMRHYHATLLLCTPSRRYLDRRVRDQMDFLVKVAYNQQTEFVHSRFVNYTTGEVTGLRVYGPNYREMYDSWSPIALRKKVLDIRRSL